MRFEDNFHFHERAAKLSPTHPERAHRVSRRKRIMAQINEWNRRVAEADPTFRQITHLIQKFGGIIPFCIAAGLHPLHVLDVLIPRGGLLPTKHLAKLMGAARYWGIYLKPEDIYPDFIEGTSVKNLASNREVRAWLNTVGTSNKDGLRRFEDQLVSLVATLE